jgi:hypothetical protein
MCRLLSRPFTADEHEAPRGIATTQQICVDLTAI